MGNNSKISELYQKKIDASSWIDLNCYYSNYLICKDNTVTNNNSQFVYIFGKKRIVGKSSFSVVFSKI